MNRNFFSAALAVLLILSSTAAASGLQTEVFPAEEELYQAYLLGDIDYETYLNLKEIFQMGIDSASLYLLEEIPSLNYIPAEDPEAPSDLAGEQTAPFLDKAEPESKRNFGGSSQWRRYQRLEEEGEVENQLTIRGKLDQNWSYNIRARQEYDEKREFTGRSLTYHSRRGQIRKLVIGNYTARFGLGLNLGYRGRLLDKGHISSEKTLAFPDFGGYNGLYAEGGGVNHGARGMIHYDEDNIHRVTAVGVNFYRKFGPWRGEIIALGTKLESRPFPADFNHHQFGFLFKYQKRDWEAALETALPRGTHNAVAATLLETRYNPYRFDLAFSAWNYDADFINLFGGGRSGRIYDPVEISEIGLEFSDRRRDQKGLLVKSRSRLTSAASMNVSFTVYGRDRDDRAMESLIGLERTLGSHSRLGLYYEYDRRETGGTADSDNRYRLDYRFHDGSMTMRAGVGYRYDTDDDKKYLSPLVRLNLKGKGFEELEIWLNLSRFNIETGQTDYFYAFIRQAVRVTDFFNLGAKGAYRYSRSDSDKEQLTILLESTLIW